jgi:hypothetical protein
MPKLLRDSGVRPLILPVWSKNSLQLAQRSWAAWACASGVCPQKSSVAKALGAV